MITIQVPILAGVTQQNFSEYCKHFDCELLPVKKKDIYWTVQTHDPQNFFWMGANMNFQVDTGLSISPAGRFLKPKKEGNE